MRFSGELDENYGETPLLISLCMLQDCPVDGIPIRKVIHHDSLFSHIV